MPKVGTVDSYTPNQVKREPLPGVRVSTNAPDEAFNIGQSAANLQASSQRNLQKIQSINDAYVRQADDTVVAQRANTVLAADNEFRQKLKGMTGADALAAKNQMESTMGPVQAQALKDLTPNQRAKLAPKISALHGSLDATVNEHMGTEIPKFQAKVEDDSIKLAQDRAFGSNGNDGVIEESIGIQEAAVTRKLDALGYHTAGVSDPGEQKRILEARQYELQQVRSKTYAGVLNGLIESKQLDRAQQFFDVHEGQLGVLKDSIQKTIAEEKQKDLAGLKAAEIFSGSQDFIEATNKLNDIQDEEFRKQTKVKLENIYHDQSAKYNESEKQFSLSIAKDLGNSDVDLLSELRKNRAALSPAYYTLAKNALSNPNGFDPFGQNFSRLAKEWSNIHLGDVYNRTEKMLSFRYHVLAERGNLNDDEFKKLLSLSDDKTVGEVAPKMGLIQAGIVGIENAFKKVGAAGLSQAVSHFIENAVKPSVKEADLPVLQDNAVNQAKAKTNPNFLKYKKGDVINTPNGTAHVTGFDPEDGEPMIEYDKK